MDIMPNNLNRLIKASGMSKQQVAAAKGVTPETLSRHISERVTMTKNDAVDYANILHCLPEDVLFAFSPMPIIAQTSCDAQGKWLVDWRGCETDDCTSGAFGRMYMNSYYRPGHAIIEYNVDRRYTGLFVIYRHALQVIRLAPVTENYVDELALGEYCWFKTKEPLSVDHNKKKPDTIFDGLVYELPGNRYTIFKPDTYDIERQTPQFRRENRELEWATPIIGQINNHVGRGIEIVR
jgi:hypothetical protein